MVDAVVRPHTPATSKHTPAGGAPTAPHSAAEAQAVEASEPRIDLVTVNDLLLGTWGDTRREAREIIKDPLFWRVEGMSMAEHRERVLAAAARARRQQAGRTARSPRSSAATTTTAATSPASRSSCSPTRSLQIKSGVQWGLFGSAIYQLGTETHHDEWLPDVIDLEVPGAFAMTETGHGSDVAAIGTTATYDPATRGVRHPHAVPRARGRTTSATRPCTARPRRCSPSSSPRASTTACTASTCRSATRTGEFLPGIGGEDDGVKGGLNGIDNGRLHFDHVRIPRTNLLNRYGDVAADGTYSSAIAAPAAASSRCSARWCRAASRSTAPRRRGSALGAQDRDHVRQPAPPVRLRRATPTRRSCSTTRKHQRRLLPRLAQTYAQASPTRSCCAKFDDVFGGAHRHRRRPRGPRDARGGAQAARHVARAGHAAGVPRGVRRRRLPRREPARRPARRPRRLRRRSRATTTCCCSSSASACSTDYAKQFKGTDARRLARYAVGQTARPGLPRRGAAPARRRPSRDFGSTARSVEPACASRPRSASCSPDRVETMVAEIAAGLRPRSKLSPKEAAAVCSTRTSTSSSRRPARTPSCCSGRRSPAALEKVDRRGHPAGPHVAARPVRPRR